MPKNEKNPLRDLPTVEVGSISDLIQDADNANLGTPRGTYMIQESIQNHGAGRSVVVDKSNRLIGGNKTTEGWAAAGLEKVIFIESDGDALIVHRRRDLDLTDPEGKARQLAVADNRASELNLNWDMETLARQVNDGADYDAFWFPEEFDRALELAARHAPPAPEEDAEDGYAEVPTGRAAAPAAAASAAPRPVSSNGENAANNENLTGAQSGAEPAEPPAASADGNAGGLPEADRPSAYRQQYGVIVICKDEAEQQDIYERLHGDGLTCRVVVT